MLKVWGATAPHFFFSRDMNSEGKMPYLGFGLGLRPKHYRHILDAKPSVDWFEIISENYMDTDGTPRRYLEKILAHYPIVMHGVSLSIGTIDPLNSEYLEKLKKLASWVKPAWISDHLCWTGVAHRNLHDLLPVPYTEEALRHIVGRIKQVQEHLETPLALENPSTYLQFTSSQMSEAEFISRMASESGCRLLLDVNNIYVTCFNHGLDPKEYLDALPLDRVIQVHLAGHSNHGTHIIDTHDDVVIDEVWALYKYLIHKAGRVPNTMVEWDDKIPEFEILFGEIEKARLAAKEPSSFGSLPKFEVRTRNVEAPAAVELSQQQVTFQNAVISTETSPALDWILSTSGLAATERLEIYRNAYSQRLADVVALDYPALSYYLGEEEFRNLLQQFIAEVPSNHFNIGRYTVKLVDFMKGRANCDLFALELCALETALVVMGDEEETVPLDSDALVSLKPEDVVNGVLVPRKAATLLAFENQANRYYQDFIDGLTPKAPEATPSWVAVFRHEDQVWRMDLSADEFKVLSRLFCGASLENAIDSACSDAEDSLVESVIQDWFNRWVSAGIFSELKI